jgi:hypothetical protein
VVVVLCQLQQVNVVGYPNRSISIISWWKCDEDTTKAGRNQAKKNTLLVAACYLLFSSPFPIFCSELRLLSVCPLRNSWLHRIDLLEDCLSVFPIVWRAKKINTFRGFVITVYNVLHNIDALLLLRCFILLSSSQQCLRNNNIHCTSYY